MWPFLGLACTRGFRPLHPLFCIHTEDQLYRHLVASCTIIPNAPFEASQQKLSASGNKSEAPRCSGPDITPLLTLRPTSSPGNQNAARNAELIESPGTRQYLHVCKA